MGTAENRQKTSLLDLINVMLLIGGTCIGGGMLVLPVSTGQVGFLPSTLVMLLSWLFMTATGLLILEVNLWLKGENVHMISMASRMLGPIGKALAWVIYLFVCYASLIAYTAGGGSLVTHIFSGWSISIDKVLASALFAAVFGLFVYLGRNSVGKVNTLLFGGMLGAYAIMVLLGASHVDMGLLLGSRWSLSLSLFSLPLLLTSFSYQYIIPSLTPMLKSNAKLLRWAIVGGTTIALLFYLVWQWMVLGIVPWNAPHGLSWAYAQGEPATVSLQHLLGDSWISTSALYFAFFALVTSFLGIALGLFDFLADGLKIPERGWGSVVLIFLVIVPTFVCAVSYARVFILALDTSGGFGDGIMNGLMPVAMVWIGRYKRKWASEQRLPGGKAVLVAVFLFALLAIGIEVWQLVAGSGPDYLNIEEP